MAAIRPEMPGDEEGIRKVHRLAFVRDAEGKLVDSLRNSRFYEPGLSIVALEGADIVGHILLSAAVLASDFEAMPVLALAPMAVIPGHQGKGIGGKLFGLALKRVEKTRYPAIVVLGHPEYYPRFGFVQASKKGIYAPFTVPDETFMVLEILPGMLGNVSGTVRYPPCFGDVWAEP